MDTRDFPSLFVAGQKAVNELDYATPPTIRRFVVSSHAGGILSMTAEVLVFSRDQLLLETRQLILGAFFQARGAGNIEDAEALLAMHRFDLIVLCSTLSEQECERVLELVEYRKPRPQILIMGAQGCDPPRYAADHVLMIGVRTLSIVEEVGGNSGC